MFAADMTRTMMLLGVSTIQELRAEGRELIRHRSEAFFHATPAEGLRARLAYEEMSAH
jgi:L-lactate dehydrogenase (cytochrome)